MHWAHRREARTLLDFERRVIGEFDAGVFVSKHEAALFRTFAPEFAGKVIHAENGVDLEYFAPDSVLANLYAPTDKAIVFVGAMYYWPNIDRTPPRELILGDRQASFASGSLVASTDVLHGGGC